MARAIPDDHEAAIFHALAILGVAYNSPPDKTYARQKQAAEILNRLPPLEPDHPGIAHYMIHSFDYPELAPSWRCRAARAYAKIAPSAPHALHMPSHIFTRLGMWQESIESNLASAAAAQARIAKTHPGATAYDALHAMDYLEYAYLQTGDDAKARGAVAVAVARRFDASEFAAAYALAAFPARYALERRAWKRGGGAHAAPASFPWDEVSVRRGDRPLRARRRRGARRRSRDGARGLARLAGIQRPSPRAEGLRLGDPGRDPAPRRRGLAAPPRGRTKTPSACSAAAADLEDRTDKHPVTPGSVLPAREQLADLLLERRSPTRR